MGLSVPKLCLFNSSLLTQKSPNPLTASIGQRILPFHFFFFLRDLSGGKKSPFLFGSQSSKNGLGSHCIHNGGWRSLSARFIREWNQHVEAKQRREEDFTWYCMHALSQARILERVAISFSRGSSRPRGWTQVSCIFCIGRWVLYHWATWEAPHLIFT